MTELLMIAKLVTRSALHIGGAGGDSVTDDLVRRNAQGDMFIPGSAIAGPLRAVITRLAPRLTGNNPCAALSGRNEQCKCWVCDLFGEVNPQEGDEKGGRASLLWVYDAKLSGATSIRDGVGIERTTGAAARQGRVKFDFEALPFGATFDVRMALKAHPEASVHGRNQQLLALALHEWQAGRGTLGGRVARGLGAFDVTQIDWYERKITTTKQLMDFLRRQDDDFVAGAAALSSEIDQTEQAKRVSAAQSSFQVMEATPGNRLKDLTAYATARSWMEAEFTLEFQGPMLINDLARAGRGGFDHAPWKDGIGLNDLWVLPGSSLRGVLRSQAEKIARTIVTQSVNTGSEFLQRCPAGDPNNSGFPDAPLANSDCLLRASNVSGEERVAPIQLDLADQLFGSVRLGSRLLLDDGKLENTPQLKALDFLAIDRFTGGGRDSAKFDALVLWKPTFRTRLRLDNPVAWELGWLLLTLRDLHDGLTTVGFGASKGFGEVKIRDWKVALGFLTDTDFPAEAPHATADAVAQLGWAAVQGVLQSSQQRTDGLWRVVKVEDKNIPLSDQAGQIAEGWVKAFNTHLEGFRRVTREEAKRRQGVPRMETDSYFDGRIDKLYPKENARHG